MILEVLPSLQCNSRAQLQDDKDVRISTEGFWSSYHSYTQRAKRKYAHNECKNKQSHLKHRDCEKMWISEIKIIIHDTKANCMALMAEWW